MKAQNIVMIILILLLIGGGIYLFSTQNKQTSKVSESVPTSAESTTPQPSTTAKTYTLSDVSQHASETDCWMAIEEKVYNVTEFVGKHPGGKAILQGCGKDATELFTERPTNNKGPHPDQARQLLETFYIGELSK